MQIQTMKSFEMSIPTQTTGDSVWNPNTSRYEKVHWMTGRTPKAIPQELSNLASACVEDANRALLDSGKYELFSE